ncbi:MAG: N-6 DNA methylase [Prevotellaceae bacterium]|nr:N-6 DNA methylase [Prevotellaceae bacterium]
MLLQRNIVKKYLNLLSEEQVAKPWAQYTSYFLNEEIQANIHKIKEEQFQEGFLRELFVKVLGYTINPSPNYNLTTELKNEVGSKKADGAILIDDKAIGVIELKDHKTPDLASIENQAFGYKNKHKETRLVIISNFEKLRLYIDNAVEYREWDIFHMKEDDFRELYLCLAWEQVAHGIALQMKSESVSNEEQITKALYKDYSQFKRVLFAEILAQNPTPEGRETKDWQLLLFKKTQKLLDRLLFIFFAEDCGLLPPNSMVKIIEQWVDLQEKYDEYFPLYDRIKKYFGYMNTGHQGKQYEIFAYNGGLFKPDEILDHIKISDDVLAEHTRKLSEYDFESDVDVNILGHIFENSLSEIEEVTQQITSGEAPQVSKRKQDGVFYTPQYITKYIVENTVGRLCAEKKQELHIVEDEYLSEQRRQIQTKKRLLEQLHQYREWLLSLTILDPACGSGAFLNAALQFLMSEHKHIDEMEAKVTGSSIVFQDIENSILENNLYGVDINEESVEIAQLALWLRTAKPHRKLNTLNQNIKCGNSLISDPAIAGEKAFDWQKEFPQVFEKGGFDVVIGNPPYVRPHYLNDETKRYLWNSFQTYERKADLYVCFIEKALNLVKQKGLTSFIVSDGWLRLDSFEKIRQYILQNASVLNIVDFTKDIFESATVKTCIFIFKEGAIERNIVQSAVMDENVDLNNIAYHSICQEAFNNTYKNVFDLSIDESSTMLKNRMQSGSQTLGTLFSLAFGLKTGDDERFLTFNPSISTDCKKLIRGADVNRWTIDFKGEYVIYQPEQMRLHKSTARPGTAERFEQPKVLVRDTGGGLMATFDNYAYYAKDVIIIEHEEQSTIALKALAILLNSRLLRWFYETTFPTLHVQRNELASLPIPNLKNTTELSVLADTMLTLHQQLQEKRSRFLRRLTENLEGVKITSSLQAFDTMDFKGFVAELKKQKIKLTLSQQDEWEEYFNQRVAECQKLSAQIKATDNEIDNKVFDLYGLTEEERKIVMTS